jgi:hypothetical protein
LCVESLFTCWNTNNREVFLLHGDEL